MPNSFFFLVDKEDILLEYRAKKIIGEEEILQNRENKEVQNP